MNLDLNCDMGEGYGPWHMGADSEIMPFITSANVACGAHAGDPQTMAATIRLAREHGVSVGAHPGYPDILGFGRRPLPIEPREVEEWILFQIGALYAIARSQGVELSHVKPHGALYNTAAKDANIASSIVRAVKTFSTDLVLYCPPNSQMDAQARLAGVKVVREGFADRGYEPNGSLMQRDLEGAVHHDPARATEQALQLAEGWVLCSDGSRLQMQVDTICIHSDSQGAPQMVQAVRHALEAKGIEVTSMRPNDR